jgi:uncharacterized protein (TIGR00251 family)
MEIPSYLRDAPEGCRISVRVHPRARRNRVAGEHGGALKVEVTAPPEGGAANVAVEELVASLLGVAKRAVTVVVGHGSRSKTLSVTGVDAASAAAALDG